MNNLVNCLQQVSFLLYGYVFTNAMSPTIFLNLHFLQLFPAFDFYCILSEYTVQ